MKHALLHTLPGRAMVIGSAVKLVVFALTLAVTPPGVVRLLDTVASIALVLGGLFFVARGLAFAQRRLLWRVRRKLIISYIFIGFIPAILIIAFCLLGGLLLFSNFSAYVLQVRLQSLTVRAQAVASTTTVEIQRAGGRGIAAIVARRQAAVAREAAGASIAVVPMTRPCDETDTSQSVPAPQEPLTPVIAGPWAHVPPPSSVPDWVPCTGFQGLLAYADLEQPVPERPAAAINGKTPRAVDLVARAVVMPDSARPTYAVVVDLLVDASMRDELRSETGVALTTIEKRETKPKPRDEGVLQARTSLTTSETANPVSALPATSASFPDTFDWRTGETMPRAVMASMQLSIAEMYGRMAATQGSIGQNLLVVLILIGVLFLVIEIIALVTGLALARSITGSVHELFAGTERVRLGDFTHKIAISARDQLGELAESFNSMTASIEDLLRIQAEKKRLEEELRIAHEIQMSLLPQGPLGFPGVSVTSICVPAREVGGDYFDILPLDDHRLGVLIADVSGKGTSAALYMAEMKGLMLSLSRNHTSPRALLVEANRIIAEHLNSRSFITMIYAIIDLRARTLTYARAGHTPLLCLPGPLAPLRGLRMLAPDGMVLGLNLDSGETFERLLHEETMPIHEGDMFLFFTDGISEAMDCTDECFGEARLGRIVEEHAHLPPDELRERILREIAAFVGDAPQHDDMTLILLRVDAPVQSAPSHTDVAELAPL
jgi:sigma-B regulation protein RsbU (phosphoserine phosphatase)